MPPELQIAAGVAKEIGNIDKFLRNLMTLDLLFKDNLKSRQIRKVVDQLEYIYFSRDGVKGALQKLRDKKIVNGAQRDKLINEINQFYNDNPRVFDTVNELTNFFNSAELRYGEETTEIGILITYVKTKVREAIWGLFNDLDAN